MNLIWVLCYIVERVVADLFRTDRWTDGRTVRHDKANNIILNSVRQDNHTVTKDDCKATCFDCRLVILRPILSIVSQDVMHTLGSHRVYIHGIHQIKSFVSKSVTCKLCSQDWDI